MSTRPGPFQTSDLDVAWAGAAPAVSSEPVALGVPPTQGEWHDYLAEVNEAAGVGRTDLPGPPPLGGGEQVADEWRRQSVAPTDWEFEGVGRLATRLRGIVEADDEQFRKWENAGYYDPSINTGTEGGGNASHN